MFSRLPVGGGWILFCRQPFTNKQTNKTKILPMKKLIVLLVAVAFVATASVAMAEEKAKEAHKCTAACKDGCKSKEAHKCTEACKEKCAAAHKDDHKK